MSYFYTLLTLIGYLLIETKYKIASYICWLILNICLLYYTKEWVFLINTLFCLLNLYKTIKQK